jgi:predicted transcriptional regulator
LVPKVPSLKRIRESRFLTQQELADKSGVHRVTVANLEGGQEEARFSTIRKLAAALEVAPADLVQASA